MRLAPYDAHSGHPVTLATRIGPWIAPEGARAPQK